MKFGDIGLEVQEMQEALLDQFLCLTKYGADAHYGNETQHALNMFERMKGLPDTVQGSEVSEVTLDSLGWDSPEDPPVPDAPKVMFGDVLLYDLRGEPWSERNQKKFKRYRGKPVVRDPAQVTGITVHQTAAKYGVAPYQVHAVGGNVELALARRSLRVACHVMAFHADHAGFIAAPNDLTHYVYHGNGFNAFELGIEIDGNYPGVEGGKTWNGKRPTKITAGIVRAACAGIEYLVVGGRKMGMPIEYIHAHRQSSAKRRDDPGEELWNAVVLDFAVDVLGLKTEPSRVLRDGRPVPVDWDADGSGSY